MTPEQYELAVRYMSMHHAFFGTRKELVYSTAILLKLEVSNELWKIARKAKPQDSIDRELLKERLMAEFDHFKT